MLERSGREPTAKFPTNLTRQQKHLRSQAYIKIANAFETMPCWSSRVCKLTTKMWWRPTISRFVAVMFGHLTGRLCNAQRGSLKGWAGSKKQMLLKSASINKAFERNVQSPTPCCQIEIRSTISTEAEAYVAAFLARCFRSIWDLIKYLYNGLLKAPNTENSICQKKLCFWPFAELAATAQDGI